MTGDRFIESRRLLFRSDGRVVVEVWQDQVVLDGAVGERRRLVVNRGRPGVVIVALRDGEVLLVRQWRPAVEADCWELPRGFGEAAVLDDATRELREETGLAGAARLVGMMWPDPGLIAGEVAVVAVEVEQGAEPEPVDGEVDEARWVPLSQVDDWIREGRVRDALSLGALALWRAERPR